ncbi:MAG: response regulator [Desulfobacterales bacterium]|nr:response regulator [Desulfobacterales bacterium]
MNPEKSVILIIDDNVNNIKVIVDYLKKSGFETAVARNGIIGLKRAKLLKPALILLDIMMPEMDGFETCRRLKENNVTKDIPVIFMTALDNIENKLRAFTCGGVDYITKPAQREEVLARVNTHLKIRNQAIEIETARQTAVQADKAKSQFLANMSHEIRTPMNAIINMARFLADTRLDTEQKEYTDTILASSDILLSVIKDILDFSKIEAGKLDLEILDFNPRDMAGELARFFSSKADEKGLRLEYYIAPEVPEALCGDPARIRQILLNYINNAVKFTEKGEIEINVSLKEKSDSYIVLYCSVTDTGVGIPEDRMNLLFHPFSQADASTTRKHGGTGLGLAISRQLAEMMGGEAGVESKEGVGSTFWFTAVLEKSEAEIETPKPESNKLKPDEKVSPDSDFHFPVSDIRILLVEDNPVNQKVVRAILENFGFFFDIANNGKQALKILKENDYDLVLMDIQMPEMDGIEATKIIRDPGSDVRDHNIPIIAMTAHAMRGDRDHYIEAGMDDYVSKPLNPDEVFAAIRNLLSGMGCLNRKSVSQDTTGTSSQAARENKVFNINELMGRVGGSEKICRDIIKELPKYLLNEITKLKTFANENNAKMVEIQGHNIKGTAANFAAYRLTDIAHKIELAGNKGELDETHSLIEKLEQEAEKLVYALNNSGLLENTPVTSLTDLTETDILAAFAALPPELLENLENAVIRVDTDMINKVIAEIYTSDSDLADILKILANDFDFLKILELIQKSQFDNMM